MTKLEKLIHKIMEGRSISFEEAERLLINYGFSVRSVGSHHIFYKDGYEKNISIKKRSELLPYQIRMLREVIENHENNEE